MTAWFIETMRMTEVQKEFLKEIKKNKGNLVNLNINMNLAKHHDDTLSVHYMPYTYYSKEDLFIFGHEGHIRGINT